MYHGPRDLDSGVVIATKSDVHDCQVVSIEQGREFANEHGLMHFTTSVVFIYVVLQSIPIFMMSYGSIVTLTFYKTD